uniref:Aminotransferase class III-fold pyridoxal phosphate-dependent enzyme n=1 Tax=Roseihalotalea indica TaxID=2867963 RepID=A0AA49GHN4_9BACT|nr:aminotransferase class III-fold pyridoxal phosphate-dependent enzyme [Tunicatimonas sp. TK19036]
MNPSNNISLEDLKQQMLGSKKKQSDFAAYHQYCKPKLAEMLNSLKLDYSYTKAKGDYVYFTNEQGNEVPVLDFVSGFGSNFLGHNHPALKNALKKHLDDDAPMFTQSALRPAAHRLAKRLNELIPAKSNYYCHLTNSGTETVEAALKHAYKVHLEMVQREYERLTRQLHDTYHQIEDNQLPVTLPAGVKDLTKYRDDLDEYNLAQYESYQKNPVICALKGSYHGKTSSALKVTFNKTFREGFEGLSSLKTVFIDFDRPERLAEAVKEHQIEFIVPVLEGDTLVLQRHNLTKVFAMIMEVVLGEGGVKPVPDKTLEGLAQIHEEIQVPFIVDEIQTGSGRTGYIFGYEGTPLAAIEPEYVLLSKALGGGLTKVGAAMIHEKVYDLDFGILHTSTFAEDDISCMIALRALDIMTENDGFLLKEAVKKGEYLRTRLKELQQRYPNIVKDVRGRGLMTGLEFQDLSRYSPLFRYAGRQGFISLLVASYVLHHHRVRILAPLTTLFKGNPGKKRESILRVQPSAFITYEQLDTLVTALDEAFMIIHRNNEYCLTAHLLDDELPVEERTSPQAMPLIHPDYQNQVDFDARVGFVVHITELKHLVDYYLPSFKQYNASDKKLTQWWNKLCRFLEPDVMHRTYIEQDGFVVELNLVCVPYFPKYMIKTYANAQLKSTRHTFHAKYLLEMEDKIMDAAVVARDLGDERIPTSLVGLGAYTSIVTRNGTTLNDYEIPVTSGNAYTTALMGQGIIKAFEETQQDISSSSIAVVGAAGNIGSTLTGLLSFYAGKLYLIGSGKAKSTERIQTVIDQSLYTILQEVKNQMQEKDLEEVQLQGLAGAMVNDVIRPALLEENPLESEVLTQLVDTLTSGNELSEQSGSWLHQAILDQHQGTNPYFEISTLEVLKECEAVAIATNSSDAWLIGPDQVKKGAIVCCASVPSNLSDNFQQQRGDHFVFDGGYARLPENNQINFVGMPKDGMAYGCLSETLLLAFDGQNSSFTKGPVTLQQVMKTIEMADQYGFELGEFRLGDSVQRAYQ